MNGIDFFFCDFQENIIARALENEPAATTLFVFPTESSKALAMRHFQERWEFTTTQFLTIEELKELAFLADKPLLKEEKRTLAFFSALSEEDRLHFRARNYFQSIELAEHFFELWEEFNEEMVPPNRPRERFSDDENFLPWQQETYQRLLKIREQYRQSIETKNFSDTIFINNPQHFDMSFFEELQRIVFVNQFYYTNLEKFLLRQFAAAGKIVRLYYQLPEEVVDKNTLAVSDFDISDMDAIRTKEIHLFEAPNHFSLLLKFFDIAEKTGVSHVVDVGFQDRSYARFLSPAKFRLSRKIRFTETTVFRLLQTLSAILQNVTFDQKRQDYLLPLQSILEAALNEESFHFIMNSVRETQQKFSQEEILDEIYRLISDDFRYVDFQSRFFKIQPNCNCREFILSLMKILSRLLQIRSLDELIRWVNHPQDGIDLEKVCSDFELHHSDIRTVFYQALGDFAAIEQVFFKKNADWAAFFKPDGRNDAKSIPGGLLRLLVDYIKAKRVTIHSPADEKTVGNRISVSSLEDTRNISYSQVAVWNASEDVIPAPRKTPFLFTENQRRRLGLKTYEEVRARERYYFFRMIFNAQEVFLFSLKNIEQNIDVSSFVEELRVALPDLCSETEQVEDRFYSEIYQLLLPQTSETIRKQPADKKFYRIPLKREIDFPNNVFELSYYRFADMTANLFVFFLRYIAGVDEIPDSVEEDFSVKFLGNFAHDVLNLLWSELVEKYAVLESGYDFSAIERETVKKAIAKVRNSESNYYKFPQTYAAIYFDEILSEIFLQQFIRFFEMMEEMFRGKKIGAFPEKDYGTIEERKAKRWIDRQENEGGVEVRIKGRRDLLIEDHSEQATQFHIFDYKSGKNSDFRQLLFYELFYFLIEGKADSQNVHSYFFQIMEGKIKSLKDLLKKKDKSEQIDLIKETILDALRRIQRDGFSLPELKSKLGPMQPITRGDLFLKQKAKAANPDL